MTPRDQDDRDRARKSLRASVVVEAGAGTGKTTLLTDRILFLALAGPTPPRIDQIVALTFTDKAAAEIKVRLSERLVELVTRMSGSDLPQSAVDRADRILAELAADFAMEEGTVLERARAALEDLDKAPIGTIHSFCATILRLFPLEAKLDPGFRVDKGELFDAVFESSWAKWLDDELGETPPNSQAWLKLLSAAKLDDVEALARELSSERVDLDRCGFADPQSAGSLRALAAKAESLHKGRPKPQGKILDKLEKIALRLNEAAVAAEMEDPPIENLIESPILKSEWPKSWGDDEAAESTYLRMLKLANEISPRAEGACRLAVRLLIPFARGLRGEYSRRGFISFDGLLKRARDLVRDMPRCRAELKRRYAAILVDEFQDTDPLQGELLLYLSEDPDACASRWTDIVPAPGRLFVVGDPKQSIYRFRGADIAAYDGFIARLKGYGALSCDLTENFRSLPGVIGPVNDVFTRVMLPQSSAQPVYKPISAARAAAVEPVVRVTAVSDLDGKRDAELSRRTEAVWIAARILEEAKAGRPLKDFAILLRTSASVPAFLDVFKRAGIAYVVEIERHFFGAPEVGDLINLLRVLDEPSDRTAMAGLLRSPMVAVNDEVLLRLSRAPRGLDFTHERAIAGVVGEDRDVVSALYGVLRGLRAKVGRIPVGDLVHAAIRDTRLVEFAARAYHGQQTASNLMKLQRLAAEAAEARGATLKDFILEAQKAMRESRREGESPLADERLEAVRIMTIHKSKGLEFPVVFVADLSAAGRAGKKAALRYDWSRDSVAARLGDLSSCAAALLESREKEMERLESVRLLYVAMTRAKDRLYLVGREASPTGSLAEHLAEAGAWPIESAQASLPTTMISAGSLMELEVSPVVAPARSDAARTVVRRWNERESRWASGQISGTIAATDYLREAPKRPSVPVEDGPVATSFASSVGADVGMICHGVLQDWDFAASAPLDQACALVRRRLEKRVPGPLWAQAEAEANAILSRFLSSPIARLLAGADIIAREVPFVYARGPAVVRGVIDLIYCVQGKLVVADYKSEHVDERSAATLADKYAEQGRIYTDAVRQAWGEDASFHLIFLRRPDLGAAVVPGIKFWK